MSAKHKLLIRSITRDQKEQDAADLLTGQAVVEFIKIMEGKAPLASTQIGGEQELTEQQRARLPYVIAARQPCLLCAGKAYVVNHWAIPAALTEDRPDNVIFFALCELCFRLPSILQLVTQELLSRLNGERVKSPLLSPQ
jgi:hypothetical protein